MDDVPNSGLWIAIVCVTLLYRLLNNLLKAGYMALGRISLLSLAERAKDTHSRLQAYLEVPGRLSFALQLFDKVTLFILVWGLVTLHPAASWVHYLILALYLLFLDFLLPAWLGALKPEDMVLRLFPLLRWPFFLLTPISLIFGHMARFDRLRDNGAEDEAPEDIKAFLRAGTEEGIIEEKETGLLHNLIAFNDTVVREVMTPRTDMECVEITQPVTEIEETFKTTKFSRLPVYRGDIDHIEGILRLKDLDELTKGHRPIENLLTEALFVPENKSISDQLQEMLKRRLQMAVVIDEFGGTAGLVTLEDLIEEIVGEIHDEHETPESDEVIAMDDGAYLVDGKVLLEDFCELFNVDLDDDDVDTIGGYIFNHEGQIPVTGDTFTYGALAVEIIKSDGRRIYQIRVTPQMQPLPEPNKQEN